MAEKLRSLQQRFEELCRPPRRPRRSGTSTEVLGSRPRSPIVLSRSRSPVSVGSSDRSPSVEVLAPGSVRGSVAVSITANVGARSEGASLVDGLARSGGSVSYPGHHSEQHTAVIAALKVDDPIWVWHRGQWLGSNVQKIEQDVLKSAVTCHIGTVLFCHCLTTDELADWNDEPPQLTER